MKQGSEDHPKFRMLARFLKIPLPYANGIMERLWLKAGAFKPSGAVGEWSNVEIAENCAMPIETDVDAFVEALVQARFLDRVDGPARLAIHDWRDHCTHYTHNKLANHQQFFADGKAPKIERLQGRDRRERAAVFYNSSVSAQNGDMSAQEGDMSAQEGDMSAQTEIPRSTKALGVSAQKADMSAHRGSNARARPTPTPTPTPNTGLSPSGVSLVSQVDPKEVSAAACVNGNGHLKHWPQAARWIQSQFPKTEDAYADELTRELAKRCCTVIAESGGDAATFTDASFVRALKEAQFDGQRSAAGFRKTLPPVVANWSK